MTGLEFLGLPPDADIGTILSKLYVFGVGLVALSALVMFTLGGVRYMLSGDRDPTEAKNWMKNAFWGLVLALTSWLILYTINPDLVKTLILQPLGIQQLSGPQPQFSGTPIDTTDPTALQQCAAQCGVIQKQDGKDVCVVGYQIASTDLAKCKGQLQQRNCNGQPTWFCSVPIQ